MMFQNKFSRIVFLLLIVAALSVLGSEVGALEVKTVTIEHGGLERSFEYYIPTGYDGSRALPLVLSFHGLGSNAAGQQGLTRLHILAEDEGFIAVFPNSSVLEGTHPHLPALPGANVQWNIGMPMSLQYFEGVDDIGFVEAIIDHMSAEYKIDQERIFATGMSNGAMFSYYLAAKLPDRIAGIAAVTSPMTINIPDEEEFKPVTVIIMNGTEDPIVEYEGREGFTLSTDETVAFWVEVNGITAEPVEEYLPQTTENDPTMIKRTVYSGGVDGVAVILYRIEGGGHTWPGGPQYFPLAAIGPVSRHIDGSAVIWADLMEYGREAKAVGIWLYYAGAGAFILLIIAAAKLLRRNKKKACCA